MTEKQEIKEINNFLAKKPFYIYLLLVLVPWVYVSLSYHYPAQMLIVTLAGVLVLYIYMKLKYQLKILFDNEDILPDYEDNKDAN